MYTVIILYQKEGYKMQIQLEENRMVKFLQKFDKFPFVIKYQGNCYTVGEGTPIFTVNFKKELDVKELLKSTSLALGEAYMRGDLEIEGDLYEALDHFLCQMEQFSTDQSLLKKLLFPSNSKKMQKKEVCSHYDIGNDFYQLWLDKTMSYSCGYFKNDTDSLYQAQVNKADYILQKLYLKPNMTLLDIGCGWGFLLIEAAKKYHVKGMGITLSKEQYEKCKERITQEGLQNEISIELLDYRDLKYLDKKFDRIVSVGMLEHVGREQYHQFLSCVYERLKPQGLFLLHYISAKKENPGDAWIKKYIFPGGVIPSLREIIQECSEFCFDVLDVENLRLHYHKTLLFWDKNFREQLPIIRTMFDEEFVRMWDLYLCSCAAAFHNGVVDLHQILLTKGVNNHLPITRWY